MKIIFYAEKLKPDYYIDYHVRTWHNNICELLTKDMASARVGCRYTHQSWENVLLTEAIPVIPSTKECIEIEGYDYEIIQVSHSSDGIIHCKTNKKIYLEDKETEEKLEIEVYEHNAKAKENRENLKLLKSKDIEYKVAEELNKIKSENASKKWYQF